MQQSDTPSQELRAIFRSRVSHSFSLAGICLQYARTARSDGARSELAIWIERVRVLRRTAARWREQAKKLSPVATCILWCFLNGCAKAPPREFAVDFSVQPSLDGTGVLWSLSFTKAQYQAMLDSTSDSADINALVHHKVREIVTAGLKGNRLTGCSADKWIVATLQNGGIAFLGTCPIPAQPLTAGGI